MLATSGVDKVSRAEVYLWRVVLLGAFLILWEAATRRGWVDPFFVSQPTVLAMQIADWIRTGKVVMVVSLVFFVVFFSTYTGIREVDRDLVYNARILGASPRHMIRHVLLPSALTWIFASLRTSVGFALIGAVVGEYLGSHEGMGYVISYAESMFNATGVLAGLLVLMAAVIAIDIGLQRLDARFSYWKPVPK